jgi:hypothetical protein
VTPVNARQPVADSDVGQSAATLVAVRGRGSVAELRAARAPDLATIGARVRPVELSAVPAHGAAATGRLQDELSGIERDASRAASLASACFAVAAFVVGAAVGLVLDRWLGL